MTREEAIERVRTRFDKWALDNEDLTALQALDLVDAESEDERIRKWIKKEIEDKYVVEGIVNNKLADEAFGWLEKQKHLYETTKDRFYREGFEEGQLYEKQKDASKAIEAVDRIDKYIDEHLANAHDMKDSNPDKKYYRGWDDALGKMSGILQDVYSNEKRKEDKPSIFPPGLGYVRWNPISSAEWSYPYGRNETADRLVSLAECLEMDGDCLFNGYSGTECGKFLRELARKQIECKPEEWGEEDKKLIDDVINSLCCYQNTLSDYQKEIVGEEIRKLKLLKPQPKQEWSEEDEKMRQSIIKDIEFERNYTSATTGKTIEKYNEQINWLKFLSLNLKKRNEDVAKLCSDEWSEEDEEMLIKVEQIVLKHWNSLSDSFYHKYDDENQDAESCYNWLKSLRPQSKKEFSMEKAIKWLDDTFYFLDNSSGRGRDCEITTHDFDSLEEMYDSFRKAVIVDSEPHWKPTEEQMGALKEAAEHSFYAGEGAVLRTLYNDLQKRYGTC